MAVVPNATEAKTFVSGLKTFVEAIKNGFVFKGTKLCTQTRTGKPLELVCTETKGGRFYFDRILVDGERGVKTSYIFDPQQPELENLIRAGLKETTPRGWIDHFARAIQADAANPVTRGSCQLHYKGTANNPVLSVTADHSFLYTPQQTRQMVDYVRTGAGGMKV